MLGDFDYGEIARSWKYLFGTGMVFTLKITASGMVGGIAAGTLLAMLRLSGMKALAWVAAVYVNLMRSIPLVLVIFWFYFLVPSIATWVTGSSGQIQIDAVLTAVIAFIVFEAAYYCEIIRSGIQSISRGQRAAAMALGMTPWQAMAHIVLPQAFRVITPVLLTRTIVLFQDVSLVYVLSITDFVGAASKIAERDNRLPEMYLFVALVYFVASYSLSLLVERLRRKLVTA